MFYEPSYRRVEAAIAEAKLPIEALIMSPDGEISLNGEPVPLEEARPELGWISTDTFTGPGRAYWTTLLKSPVLEWVQSPAAGFDGPAFGRLVAKGARLTRNNAQSVPIGEYVLSTVLDHFQGGAVRRANQAEKIWKPLQFREIAGTRWLIVGFGGIGQAIAKRARAFDVHVTGVRRTPGDHPLADRMISNDEVVAALPEIDVVVLSLPLTPESRGMVDERFLAAMKLGSVFVNIGRGGLVDEGALLAALDEGTPEHAILDVFQTEPLPVDSPLWSHPRVTATPHASAIGSGRDGRGDALFVENLRRYLAGEDLLNEADPKDVLAGGEPAPQA